MKYTAGAELDAEVAKACGIEGKILHHPFAFGRNGPVFVKFLVNSEGSWPAIWQPSTDLNAAFEAAEKALGPTWDLSAGSSGNWECSTAGFTPKVTGLGTTATLAICAAILALKQPGAPIVKPVG